MHCVTYQSRTEEPIRIYPLADLHIGAAECNETAIAEAVQKIASDTNALVILNGDIMDTATRNSISDIYGATLSPLKQLEHAAEMLYPIKDKVIAATCGNHEGRIYKADGLDTMRLLCRELGAESVYNPAGVLSFVKFGKGSPHGGRERSPLVYTIYATHGAGGGRKEGGKINRLSDLAEIVDADIYIHSHTHLPAYFVEDYYRVDVQNGSAKPVHKCFLNTSAALSYGGYGQMQGYKPAAILFPYLELSGKAHDVKAII